MSSLRVSESILDLVGRTPLLRLTKLEPSGGAQIWAKLEYLNPGGSLKDRAAIGMVLAAERDGRLTRDSVIVEPTAGNTGIGLALIGSQRGYRVVLVVPENFSREKLLVMRALGGELVLTPEDDGIRGAIAKARELALTIPHAVVLQQFENQANPAYHHDVTGPELWEQTDGRVDAIVIGAGTGGTFTGVVRYFRERGSRALAVARRAPGIDLVRGAARAAPRGRHRRVVLARHAGSGAHRRDHHRPGRPGVRDDSSAGARVRRAVGRIGRGGGQRRHPGRRTAGRRCARRHHHS